jgi:hypothetical protein
VITPQQIEQPAAEVVAELDVLRTQIREPSHLVHHARLRGFVHRILVVEVREGPRLGPERDRGGVDPR